MFVVVWGCVCMYLHAIWSKRASDKFITFKLCGVTRFTSHLRRPAHRPSIFEHVTRPPHTLYIPDPRLGLMRSPRSPKFICVLSIVCLRIHRVYCILYVLHKYLTEYPYIFIIYVHKNRPFMCIKFLKSLLYIFFLKMCS